LIRIGANQNVFHRKNRGGFLLFEDMIEGIAELGLDLFEFCPEYLEQTPDALTPPRRRNARTKAERLNIKLVVHASFSSINITFINKHVRAAALDQLKREIKLAHDLESDIITIHPGVKSAHASWYPESHYWDAQIAAYQELLAFAAPLGVRICTENINPGGVGTEEQVAQLFANLDSPHFGLTFDFGHHNLIYNKYSLGERTEAAKSILKRFADRIWMLHVHDNWGEKDDHMAIGMGQIEYDVLMPEVLRNGLDAYWSMELDEVEHVQISKAALLAYQGNQ
jgi:sugar phosphate isomerase/epimerase